MCTTLSTEQTRRVAQCSHSATYGEATSHQQYRVTHPTDCRPSVRNLAGNGGTSGIAVTAAFRFSPSKLAAFLCGSVGESTNSSRECDRTSAHTLSRMRYIWDVADDGTGDPVPLTPTLQELAALWRRAHKLDAASDWSSPERRATGVVRGEGAKVGARLVSSFASVAARGVAALPLECEGSRGSGSVTVALVGCEKSVEEIWDRVGIGGRGRSFGVTVTAASGRFPAGFVASA